VQPIALWERSLDGEEFAWSVAMFVWTGVALDGGAPTYGRYLDMVHPDDRAGLRANHDAVVAGSPGEDVFFRLRRADGATVAGIEASWLRPAVGSAPARLAGAVVPLDLGAGAPGPLRPAWRRVLDSITDGIVVFDRELNYLYVNGRAGELLGRDPADLVGRNYYIEYPEARGTPFARAYEEAVRTGAFIALEELYEPWQRWFENRIYPTDQGILVLFTETTERRRHEAEAAVLAERLQQAQKLEAIGRLAGGVAHDFNNMLTVIEGFGESALSRLGPDHPAHAELREVLAAARRSAELTQQLLAFSRKQTLQPRVVAPDALVKELENMLRRLIGEDIDLRVVLAPDTGRIRVDPGQFTQVLLNLAANARDAMPAGGKLTVETANAFLDEAYVASHPEVKVGDYVWIGVTDTGAGLAPEVQAKIFEPFFSTKVSGQGTGLGLATVYGIVRQSGGHVWLYSEPGVGTTFKVYFPRCDEEVDPRPDPSGEPVAVTRGTRVLVVEDEPALLDWMAQSLSGLGYDVRAAPSPAEALRLVEEGGVRPELVVTDVVMPEMSGVELARRVQKCAPAAQVLFISGYTDNAIVHHGVLDAGTPFLQKPFTKAALVAKIESLLSSSD